MKNTMYEVTKTIFAIAGIFVTGGLAIWLANAIRNRSLMLDQPDAVQLIVLTVFVPLAVFVAIGFVYLGMRKRLNDSAINSEELQ